MFLDELSHCKIWIQTTSCAVIIQLASWESLCTSSFVRRNVSQNPQFDLWVYCGQNADIRSTVRARMFRVHGTDVLRSGHRRSIHWYLQCIPQILTGLYTLLVMCAKVQVFHFHFSLWWFSGSATYAVFLYKLVQIGTYVLQLALCGGGGVWFCMTSYISKRYEGGSVPVILHMKGDIPNMVFDDSVCILVMLIMWEWTYMIWLTW